MARVSDDHRAPNDYRWARQVAALLLIAVVVLIVVLDVIVEGYEVSPPVLVPLLLTAAGLLSVDLPRVRP
jgi:peptidoglycan/LPS O-acetylase OafA/YrhL